jgi:hypothetical protein
LCGEKEMAIDLDDKYVCESISELDIGVSIPVQTLLNDFDTLSYIKAPYVTMHTNLVNRLVEWGIASEGIDNVVKPLFDKGKLLDRSHPRAGRIIRDHPKILRCFEVCHTGGGWGVELYAVEEMGNPTPWVSIAGVYYGGAVIKPKNSLDNMNYYAFWQVYERQIRETKSNVPLKLKMVNSQRSVAVRNP